MARIGSILWSWATQERGSSLCNVRGRVLLFGQAVNTSASDRAAILSTRRPSVISNSPDTVAVSWLRYFAYSIEKLF
jgi:hypothetical protein